MCSTLFEVNQIFNDLVSIVTLPLSLRQASRHLQTGVGILLLSKLLIYPKKHFDSKFQCQISMSFKNIENIISEVIFPCNIPILLSENSERLFTC